MRLPLPILALLILLVSLAPAGASGLRGVPPVGLAFVEPVMLSGGVPETVMEGDEELLVFTDSPPNPMGLTDRVRAALEESPAFDLVRRLHTLARREGVAAGKKIDVDSPLYVYVGEIFGKVGPAQVARPFRYRSASGEESTPGAFIIVSDIDGGPVSVSVEALLRERYLAMTLVHEVGHQILTELYSPASSLLGESVSLAGRDVMSITDPALALNEGWAEALEALVGELLAASGATGWGESSTDPAVRAMFRGRQDILKRDEYIWDRVGEIDGETRNGLQMMASEGVAGFQLYQVMTQKDFAGRSLTGGFRQLVRALAVHEPGDLGGAMAAVSAEYPDYRPTVVRLLYEWTKYAPHSQTGPALYKRFRAAQLARKRYQRRDETSRELDDELAEARRAYAEWKEAAYVEILAAGGVSPALPDPLWLDWMGRRVGLNLATSEELAAFLDRLYGRREDTLVVAQRITEHRDSADGGYFARVEDLAPHLGDRPIDKLVRARREFARRLAAQSSGDAPAGLAAYVAGRSDRILTGRLARWLREGGRTPPVR